MENNNQHSQKPWRQRLDELETIPGEPEQNYEASWLKLRARLDADKPMKKRPVYWYWAAACILTLLFLVVMMRQVTKEPLQDVVKVNQPVPPETHGSPRKSASNTATVTVTNTRKDDSQNTIVKDKKYSQPIKQQSSTAQAAKQNRRANNLNIDSTAMAQQPTEIIIPIDSSHAARFTTLKKEPRTVHISELGPDAMPEYDNRKVRRFMRQYDVDASPKKSAARYSSERTIKHIN